MRRRARSTEPPRRPRRSTRINDEIDAPRVRLVDEDGTQLGVVPVAEARAHAERKGLDLVEVAAGADPPVCRVIDYGKFRYQEEQRTKQSRKNRTQITLKELRLRPKIGEHDFEWKTRRLRGFLEERAKVKVVVLFRGREREHPERGRDLLQRLAREVDQLGQVEAAPALDGRSMTMVVAPRAAAGARDGGDA